MKQFTIFFSLLVSSLIVQAESQYEIASIPASSCESVGHTSEYMLKNCPIRLSQGDQILIKGSNGRNELVVTQREGSSRPYYMPLGVANATHNVNGPIQVVMKRTWRGRQRHALIYRLDYTLYNGQKAFQIITVRLGTGFSKNQTTCTMYAFDSNGATRFAHLPVSQRERAMRQVALDQVQSSDFQSRRNKCMEYEHSEHRPQPQSLPADPNEGDSLESDV